MEQEQRINNIITARDIIQKFIDDPTSLPPHPFEHLMMKTTNSLNWKKAPDPIVILIEVFVDDFIAITNNNGEYES